MIALVFAVFALFTATDGLQTFTSEGARRLAIEQNPVTLPAVQLTDSGHRPFTLGDYKGKVVLVDFIFTSCTSICHVITASMRALHETLQAGALRDKVTLLTVSFDPKRDTPAVLAHYAESVEADTTSWRFATVHDDMQLQTLLDAFGIVVIPAPDDQFEHNGAIHWINPEGKLAKIHDYQAVENILKDLQTIQQTIADVA